MFAIWNSTCSLLVYRKVIVYIYPVSYNLAIISYWFWVEEAGFYFLSVLWGFLCRSSYHLWTKIVFPCYLISDHSVQFSRSVMSDSLQPHESEHARPPCPSPTPGVHSDSHPLSQWCHSAISSSVVPFSSCFQSLPTSESFPMSQHFTWGGQSTGVSALASFLPKESQGWSPSEWTSWIS